MSRARDSILAAVERLRPAGPLHQPDLAEPGPERTGGPAGRSL